MTAYVYYQSPLDPFDIRRYWADAGLAFEKHRWLFPTLPEPEVPIRLFTFGNEPLREIYVHPRFSVFDPVALSTPLSRLVLPEVVSLSPLHLLVLFETNRQQFAIDALIGRWENPVYLLMPGAVSLTLRSLLSMVSSSMWQEVNGLTIVPLPDAETRQRAITALLTSGDSRFYIIAGESATASIDPHEFERFTTLHRLVQTNDPEIDYRHFHRLVSQYDWIVTSHIHLPNYTPFCFYSRSNLRPLLLSLLQNRPAFEATDIDAFNQAANIVEFHRGGLSLAEIISAEHITGQTELSLAWSDLDSLDPASSLQTVQYLNLEGTLLSPLDPLIALPQLESINLRSLQIKDIAPLALLPKLQYLVFDHQPKAGLEPLAAIPELNSLNLDGLPIEDITSLPTCVSLKHLSLNHTPLKQLDGISRFHAIESLSIASTRITDLKPLTTLNHLEKLTIDDCKITDFAPLSCLPTLKFLSLNWSDYPHLQLPEPSALTEIVGLEHLYLRNTTFSKLLPGITASTLKSLDISGCLISDLDWLLEFEALNFLGIAQSTLRSIEFLAPLRHLEKLNLSFCHVSDLDNLKCFDGLHTLNLDFTETIDIQPLTALSNLKSLSLNGLYSNLSNHHNHPLHILSQLFTLEELNLSGWKFNSTHWLNNLTDIRCLKLARTNLQDLTPLSVLKQLRELDLGQSTIKSLEGLEHVQHLQKLNLENTAIDNIDPIRYATKIEVLSLRNTRVTNLNALVYAEKLKGLDLRGLPPSRNLEALRRLPRLELLLIDSHGLDVDMLEALRRLHHVVTTPT